MNDKTTALSHYLMTVLEECDLPDAGVTMSWVLSSKSQASFEETPRLTLLGTADAYSGGDSTILHCGVDSAIGLRRLVRWQRRGLKRLLVIPAPGVVIDEPITYWLKRFLGHSFWRVLLRVTQGLTPNHDVAGWWWSTLHKRELKKLLAAVASTTDSRPHSRSSQVADLALIAIASLGRGGAEKQALLRAATLALGSTRPTAILISSEDQARVDINQHALPIHTQLTIEEMFSNGRSLASYCPHNECPTWRALWCVLPAETWQAAVLAFVALKTLKPAEIISYLDWVNVTVGLAAALAGVPKTTFSFRNVSPNHFALHRVEFRGTYQALLETTQTNLEANSRAGVLSYRKWLGLPAGAIDFIANLNELVTEPRASYKAGTDVPRNVSHARVGWLGRFLPEKDPLLWVTAAERLIRDFPEVRGVMAGTGPMEPTVTNEIAIRGLSEQVRFIGIVTQPAHFLADVDVLMMTSKYEGSPNAIVEAIQMQTPVVAADAGDVRYIADDSTYLTVVTSRDPELFAEALTNKGVF